MRLTAVVLLIQLSGVLCSSGAHAESGPFPCVAGVPWPAAGSIPADQPAFVIHVAVTTPHGPGWLLGKNRD